MRGSTKEQASVQAFSDANRASQTVITVIKTNSRSKLKLRNQSKNSRLFFKPSFKHKIDLNKSSFAKFKKIFYSSLFFKFFF